MGVERMPTPEELKVIKMAKEQYEILTSREDPMRRACIETMHDLGIVFGMNGGMVEIDVDGEKKKMTTTIEDFGTIENEAG